MEPHCTRALWVNMRPNGSNVGKACAVSYGTAGHRPSHLKNSCMLNLRLLLMAYSTAGTASSWLWCASTMKARTERYMGGPGRPVPCAGVGGTCVLVGVGGR